MTEVRRINPEGGFVREFTELRGRVGSLETAPAGNIVIRETLTAEDPETGVKTTLGQLPDGSIGFQPFIGDIVPPPVATTPIVAVQPGIFTVSWDGLFVANEEKPRDFEHVNVIGHKMNGTTVLSSVVVGAIRLSTDTVYVTQDIAAIGESWQFSLESEDYNGNKAVRGARTASVVMESIVSDAGVTEALQELTQAAQDAAQAAQDAQTSAQDAQEDADAAAQAAIDAANLAGSKGVVYTQSATPLADYSGLWIDTAHNNIPRRYLGVRSALVANLGGGASVATRLTSLGWAVSAITTTPSVEDAAKFDLVAFDAGYAGLLAAPQARAAQLFERGVSVYTAGNDTSALAPLFTGSAQRGTPKNNIVPVTGHAAGTGWSSYGDSDLLLYLTGANPAATITGTTLVTSLGTDQPINLVMEHPTNFARWAHVQTYGTPSAVTNAHLGWISDNWVSIQDQGVISAASAAASAQNKADQAFNNAASASEAAGDAQDTADAKNRNWYQDTAPTGIGHKDGDQWFDTNDGNKLYLWKGTPTNAWASFQDAAISAASQAATGAQATADGKNTSYYEPVAPTNVPVGKLKQGDQWFDTTNSYRLSTWTGSQWQTTQDAALAKQTADAKGTIYTQSVAPPVAAQLPQNLWNDTSLGLANVVVKYWDGDSWEPLADKAATDAALLAGSKSKVIYGTSAPTGLDANPLTLWIDTTGGANTPKKWVSGTTWQAVTDKVATDAAAAAATAMSSQAYSLNASFDDWTGATPAGFTTFTTAPTKETSIIRRAPFAARWNLADTSTQAGLTFGSTSILAHAPNLEYFTVELEFQLVSGALGGSGVILDWTGMTNNRAQINLATEVPTPILGKWYKVVKTLRRPTNATGTWTAMSGYLMAQWSGHGAGAVKNLIYDWFNIRPATTEEITSYGAPAKYTELENATAAKGEVIYSDSAPAVGKQLPQNLWVDTTGGLNIHKRWISNQWTVVADSRIAQSVSQLSALTSQVSAVSAQADRSITTFYGTPTPVDAQEGDLWLTGVAGTPMKRFNNAGAWVNFEDPNVMAAYQKAGDAQTAADGKVRTFAQPDEPTGMVPNDIGDLWIDTNDKNKLWRYDGAIWQELRDDAIEDAQNKADTAFNLANVKSRTYYQTYSPPLTGNAYGDTWFDTDDLNKPYIWNGAWVSAQDGTIALAKSAADSKVETWTGSTAPTGLTALNTGDLFIDSDDGSISRWTGSAWTLVNDNGANRVATTFANLGIDAAWVTDIENQADKAITTFYGTATPTGAATGDLWLTGVAGTPMKRFSSGGTWDAFEDPNVMAAYQKADDAEALADSKIKTYAATTAPTGLTTTDTGDLWINTSAGSGAISRWDGDSWELLVDNGDAAVSAALNSLGINQTWVTDIENQADKAITTFFGTDTPVNPEEGDLWLSGTTGVPTKRRTSNAWVTFEDPQIIAAYATAVSAQGTADQKIRTFAATSEPGGMLIGDVGDLWINTSTGDLKGQIKRWDGDSWELLVDNGAAAAAKKTTTWYQPDSPAVTGNTNGDVWFDTNDQNKVYVWNGTWASARDAGIQIALNSADGKNTNYYTDDKPTGGTYKIGDLWIDTNDGNKVYAYNGSDFVTARDSGIIAAQQTADGKNKIHYSTSPASGTVDTTDSNRPFNEGDTWFQKSGTLVIGHWEFISGAWQSRKIDGVTLANLNAATIVAGDLDAARLKAGSIDASKLTIADFTNLLDDPIISTTDPNNIGPGWIKATGSGSSSVVLDGNEKTNAWRFNAVGSEVSVVNKNIIAVNPLTDKFYMSVRNYSTMNAPGYMRVAFFTETMAAVTPNGIQDLTIPTNANAWAAREHHINTIPATAKWMKISFIIGSSATSGYILYTSPVLRRKGGGELIVDGAIDGKIITGATIQSDSTPVSAPRGIKLTSTELAGYDAAGLKNFSLTSAGALTVTGTIKTGSFIEGATVIGTSGVQTSVSANRGVKMSNTGITAYNGSGNMTFKVDATTGEVEAPGIKANSITGDKIAANTLSVMNMLVSDFNNYLENPSFETGDLRGWTVSGGWTVNNTTPHSGTYKALVAYNGTTQSITNNAEIVLPVDGKVRVKFRIYSETPSVSGVQAVLALVNTVGGALESVTNITQTGTWIEIDRVLTATTAGSKKLRISTTGAGTGYLRVDSVEMYRMNAGELIVDGAVKTNHMSSGTIDAGILVVGSVKAIHIGSKAITVDKLLVSSSDNLIQEAEFAGGGLSWQLASDSPSVTGFAINGTAGRNSLPAMVLTNNATTQTSYNAVATSYNGSGVPTKTPIQVQSDVDNAYRVTAWLKSTASVPVSGAMIVGRFRNASGVDSEVNMPYTTPGTSTPATMPTAGTWYEISGIVKAPAGTVSVAWGIRTSSAFSTGTVTWDMVSATRASNGELVVDGSIRTQHLSAGNIDAGVLVAGSIKAPQIGAKAITVDKLVVSSSDNLIVEANFEHPTDPGSSWTRTPTNPNATIQVGGGRNGANALRLTGTTSQTTSWNLSNKVVVDEDSRFRASMWVKSNAAYGNGQVRLGIKPWIGATAGSVMTLFSSSSDPSKDNYIPATNAWTQITGYTAALPAGTTAVEFYISTVAPSATAFMDFDSVSVTRAADGSLVVDGAIDGKTITGALFQTDNSPLDSPDSRGIKLNGAGLKAYDPFGLQTFGIDSLTGIVSSVGTFSTESVGVNVAGTPVTAKAEFGILNDEDFDNVPGLTFQWGHPEATDHVVSAMYSAGGTTQIVSRLNTGLVLDQSRGLLSVGQTESLLWMEGPVASESDWRDYASFSAFVPGYSTTTATMNVNINNTNTVEGSRQLFMGLGKEAAYPDGRINMAHTITESSTRKTTWEFQSHPDGAWEIAGYRDTAGNLGTRVEADSSHNLSIQAHQIASITGDAVVISTPALSGGNQIVVDDSAVQLNGTVTVNGSPVGGQSVVHSMTASGTMVNATSPVPQLGQLWTDSATTSSVISAPGVGQITITDAGVYDISFHYSQTGGVTGRSFLDIAPASGGAWARTSISTGEDSGTANVNGVKVAAGTVVKFFVYQSSGGSKTYTAQVRIVKVGAPSETSNWTNTSQTIDGDVVINGTLDVGEIGGFDYTSGVAKMPFIVLSKAGTQTLTAANTWYAINWDGADVYNYQMGHSHTTNSHIITIQQSGIYEINYKVAVNVTTGHVSGSVAINGTWNGSWVQRVGNNSGQFEKAQLIQTGQFYAGDTIQIGVASGTAGALADPVNNASIRMIVPT